MKHRFLAAAALLGLCLAFSSCQQQKQVQPPPPPVIYTPAPGSYEAFVYYHNDYPKTMEIFRDDALMAQADGRNCRVAICLDQQRGRLYVKQKTAEGIITERVAADWPVSTGVDKRETPVGNFRITLKKKDHTSNRYGRMFDADGKCVNRDADAFKDEIPEGGRFEGAAMPNWMRLTNDGVGMHTGKVRAGRRLSHGCIRTPALMANKLFDITKIGTRVSISQETEPGYPGQRPLDEKARIAAEKAAEAAGLPAAPAEEAPAAEATPAPVEAAPTPAPEPETPAQAAPAAPSAAEFYNAPTQR